MRTMLCVVLLALTCGEVYADPTLQRTRDELTESTLIQLEDNWIVLEEPGGSLAFNYAGILGDDGVVQSFVLSIVYVSSTTPSEVSVQLDGERAQVLECETTHDANKSTCTAKDLDRETIEAFSQARTIHIEFGSLHGTTDPAAARLFLEQMTEGEDK